jgi:hypothetical protein
LAIVNLNSSAGAKMKHIYLISCFIVYLAAFFILFPYNRYNIDADGIAYIQQARQYAWGHYYDALNGCWSPLISWILVPFVKAGVDPVLCCKYLNGFFGACSLFSFYALLQKFSIAPTIKIFIPAILVVFCLSSAFKLLGPDGLQTLLLSLYLNLVFAPDFLSSNKKLFAAGLLGALCYYAKTYNFFFFILHCTIVLFILCRKEKPAAFARFYLSKMTLVFTAFALFTVPYIFLLSHKYQKFTISSASAITINKSLEPSFTDGRKLAVPPANLSALAIADDPTFFQHAYVTPFTSGRYFFKQVKITLWNIFDYARLLNEISIFSISILLAFGIYLYLFRWRWKRQEVLLLVTALLYPAGYLLIALEWRYIWMIPVLLLAMAAVALSELYSITRKKRLVQVIGAVVLMSFILKPIKELKENLNNREDVYKAAAALKDNGISGNFFGPNTSYLYASRNYYLCYLTNSRLFGVYTPTYTAEEVLEAAKQYRVKYFLNYYQSAAEEQSILHSELAVRSVRVFDGVYPGMVIFQLIQ